MKVERIAIVVLALALMLTLGMRLGQAQVLGPSAPQVPAANAPRIAQGDAIPIQGRLTDASGNPVPNGNYDMTFRIYDSSAGGLVLCQDTKTGATAVAVSNGLFSTTITGCADDKVSGDQLYLEIAAGGEIMSQRWSIGSVPYARSLRPGADIKGSAPSGFSILSAENTNTEGRALSGGATNASGTTYAVYGFAASPSGYGGYFDNAGAVSGAALYANGDVKQSRTGDGLAKAGYTLRVQAPAARSPARLTT